MTKVSTCAILALNLLMLENILDLGSNTMPADAMAPKVTRASAGMVLVKHCYFMGNTF